jgi:hypothetical protein
MESLHKKMNAVAGENLTARLRPAVAELGTEHRRNSGTVTKTFADYGAVSRGSLCPGESISEQPAQGLAAVLSGC